MMLLAIQFRPPCSLFLSAFCSRIHPYYFIPPIRCKTKFHEETKQTEIKYTRDLNCFKHKCSLYNSNYVLVHN